MDSISYSHAPRISLARLFLMGLGLAVLWTDKQADAVYSPPSPAGIDIVSAEPHPALSRVLERALQAGHRLVNAAKVTRARSQSPVLRTAGAEAAQRYVLISSNLRLLLLGHGRYALRAALVDPSHSSSSTAEWNSQRLAPEERIDSQAGAPSNRSDERYLKCLDSSLRATICAYEDPEFLRADADLNRFLNLSLAQLRADQQRVKRWLGERQWNFSQRNEQGSVDGQSGYPVE